MSQGTLSFISIFLHMPAIILATSLHEATRALISTLLGDDMPRREGRLTLNPISHFEPIGFLLMYSTGLTSGVGVGWGKPVSTGSRNYKNRRVGVILTAVWPSVVNFLLAVLISNLLKTVSFPPLAKDFLRIAMSYNISIIVCNLLPVSPFDCLKVVSEFVSSRNYFSISQSESIMQLIMILLLFTGLLMIVLAPVYNILARMVALLTF